MLLLLFLLLMVPCACTSVLQTHLCNAQMDCKVTFSMATNNSFSTCHCTKNGFLETSPRIAVEAVETSCQIRYLTVFASDSGVWQCQTPETRDKSQKIIVKVVGSLGSPTIEDNRGMLYLKKKTCPSFTCAATIGLKTDTYLTWMNKKTGSEIVDYLSLNNSQTTLSPTSLSRTSSIQMCVLGDMDLVCKISSDTGKFRISLPLR